MRRLFANPLPSLIPPARPLLPASTSPRADAPSARQTTTCPPATSKPPLKPQTLRRACARSSTYCSATSASRCSCPHRRPHQPPSNTHTPRLGAGRACAAQHTLQLPLLPAAHALPLDVADGGRQGGVRARRGGAALLTRALLCSQGGLCHFQAGHSTHASRGRTFAVQQAPGDCSRAAQGPRWRRATGPAREHSRRHALF